MSIGNRDETMATKKPNLSKTQQKIVADLKQGWRLIWNNPWIMFPPTPNVGRVYAVRKTTVVSLNEKGLIVKTYSKPITYQLS